MLFSQLFCLAAALPDGQELSTTDRAMGAILGSFTADAAAMPLHWIYDTKKVKVSTTPVSTINKMRINVNNVYIYKLS